MCASLSMLASGCFRASVVDARLPEGETHSEWNGTFLWGLVGDPEVDVRRHCAGPAARVRSGGDPVAAIVSVVTLGIYTPRVVRVTCSAHPANAFVFVGSPPERKRGE